MQELSEETYQDNGTFLFRLVCDGAGVHRRKKISAVFAFQKAKEKELIFADFTSNNGYNIRRQKCRYFVVGFALRYI